MPNEHNTKFWGWTWAFPWPQWMALWIYRCTKGHVYSDAFMTSLNECFPALNTLHTWGALEPYFSLFFFLKLLQNGFLFAYVWKYHKRYIGWNKILIWWFLQLSSVDTLFSMELSLYQLALQIMRGFSFVIRPSLLQGQQRLFVLSSYFNNYISCVCVCVCVCEVSSQGAPSLDFGYW